MKIFFIIYLLNPIKTMNDQSDWVPVFIDWQKYQLWTK